MIPKASPNTEAYSAVVRAFPAFPFRQWVAVEDGGGRCGRARRVDEDGGDAAAVGTALIDAEEQRDGEQRPHAEGQRDRQRDHHSRAESGDDADDSADGDAE